MNMVQEMVQFFLARAKVYVINTADKRLEAMVDNLNAYLHIQLKLSLRPLS